MTTLTSHDPLLLRGSTPRLDVVFTTLRLNEDE